MQAIPLGRVTVTTAGTPVALTLSAAQLAMLPPSQQVCRVEVWPDPAATGRVLVKCPGGYPGRAASSYGWVSRAVVHSRM
jgi:hypothetical protein